MGGGNARDNFAGKRDAVGKNLFPTSTSIPFEVFQSPEEDHRKVSQYEQIKTHLEGQSLTFRSAFPLQSASIPHHHHFTRTYPLLA